MWYRVICSCRSERRFQSAPELQKKTAGRPTRDSTSDPAVHPETSGPGAQTRQETGSSDKGKLVFRYRLRLETSEHALVFFLRD